MGRSASAFTNFVPAGVTHGSSLLRVVLFATAMVRAADGAADVVIADFETATFADWDVSGTAFGQGPRPAIRAVSGAQGRSYAGSAGRADTDGALRGSLESPEFVLERDYLNFLIGGGDHAFRTAISLWIDGRVVRTSSGDDADRLQWCTWDVREFRGRRGWIGIYDQCIEDKRGYLFVDEIRQSDTPRASPGGGVARALIRVRREAVDAIRRNAARAAGDPWRPVFHYTPPAQRMNDPNGPAWANGYHHLFYQHMVFEGGGPAVDVHWGHARSRDLVNWETLPLAIHPAYERGELSCFSGNLAWDQRGEPVQFVTMVPYKRNTFRQIWPARPLDPDWIRWTRVPELPPTGLVPHGLPDRHLKDAFPYSAGARRFLVLTDRNIPIYEALDATLSRWTYRGLLDANSAECPNFFEVEGRWIYLSSPNQPVRYVVGDFDPESARFTPRQEGRINHDMGYYASTSYRDNQGRTILHGVSRGQKSSKAWTGALALPRVLTIGVDGRPRMLPVPELASLRREPFHLVAPITLNDRGKVVGGLNGDTLEIVARFNAGTAKAFGLRVRRSGDGQRALPVMWREGRLVVAKDTPDFPCEYPIDAATREIEFHLFLDKGMLDVCTGDGRVFESRVHQAPLEDLGVEIFAEGGTVTVLSLDAWQMAPAHINHSMLFGSQ